MKNNLCQTLYKLPGLFFDPIRKNGAFCVFMYALGAICACTTVSKGGKIYEGTWTELAVDIYLVAAVLALFPNGVRRWLRRVCYVAAYGVALTDAYCFTKFGSTINPTMLLLLGETNANEAGDFLSTFLSFDALEGGTGWIVALLALHIIWSFIHHRLHLPQAITVPCGVRVVCSIACLALMIWCVSEAWDNKKATWQLLSASSPGQAEFILTQPGHAQLYQPSWRLAFAVQANRLAATQLQTLIDGLERVSVDSCQPRGTDVVLIIGESYNRNHASLYGYNKLTTPRQQRRAARGELIPFTDVVAPWNLTSFVFKLLFSFHVNGDNDEWSDHALFPEVFRKAGYHVTFLTNQFLPRAREAVYDFSGGFFLNNPTLSQAMFDTRNTKLHVFDKGLLDDFDTLKNVRDTLNLVIFHLKGQHVNYSSKCPKSRMTWNADDYDRPKLRRKERRTLAYYDNSLVYNDSIVDQIIRRFERQEAVVIYLSDHGEQVYDDDVHFICRNHADKINAHMAHNEYEIPFWIYMSPSYRVANPDVVKRVKRAADKPFMSDALPHMLVYLGGIGTDEYRSALNPLSDDYDAGRKRLLKNTTDYDEVIRKNVQP